MVELTGITWDHPRGLAPLVATAAEFERENPGIRITWQARSLNDFNDFPVDTLARDHSLVVLDHPWVGHIARTNCYVPFDQLLPLETLAELRANSVGPSHNSYEWNGHQWALAIDAATPCASYRADLLERVGAELPATWKGVVELGRQCATQGMKLAMPLNPVDAMSAFLSLAVNFGATPFAQPDEIVSDDIGVAVLDQILQIVEFCCPEVFVMSPIAVMDRMSTTDQIAYCPHAYCYSNYSREHFRPYLIHYSDMPSVEAGNPRGSHLGGTGIAISRHCPHPEIAAAYAARVAQADWQRTIYFQAGGQPAHVAAWEDAEVNRASNNFFRNIRRTMDSAYLRPRFDGYVQLQHRAGEQLTRYFAGSGGTDRETLREINRLYALSTGHKNRVYATT